MDLYKNANFVFKVFSGKRDFYNTIRILYPTVNNNSKTQVNEIIFYSILSDM